MTSLRPVQDPTHRQPGAAATALLVTVVVVGGGGLWVSMRVGTALSGVHQQVPANPAAIAVDLAHKRLLWPPEATIVAVGLGVLVAAMAVGVAVGVHGYRRNRARVDDAARHLGRGRELSSISAKGAARTATRLGITAAAPGVQIGVPVTGGVMTYGSWEDLHCDIWGPRTGKTTSRVIPAILDAPGAVITTSNKRDVVDATRGVRAGKGSTVWVFDPQKVALEEPSWWWNPLSWVSDEVKAADLAQHFAAGDDGIDAKKDAFFDPEGQDLLASLLLAAAVADRPITQVYTWVADPSDDESVHLLRAAGYTLIADGLSGQYNAPDKQRGGVFGTAKKMVRSLKISALHPWITPHGAQDGRPQFDPREFVDSGATLYSLSREGNGSAGPIVTALTVAVIEAAEEKATRSAGGRLPVPMLAALDETANVVRWAQLPSLYSHYGSRGIVIMTILQSWAQGCATWGTEGMKKLWSAANIKVYGGGVAETDFLRDLSELVGDHFQLTGTVNSSRQGRSVSQQRSKERTLTVKDLQALPRGRAVVLSSGNPATLVRTVPWMDGPHAAAVHASIAAYDPAARGGRPSGTNPLLG